MSVPAHYCYFRTFCHATEIESRIEAALRFYVGDAEVTRTEVEGHFGNPIAILESKLERSGNLRPLIGGILAANAPETLIAELDERVDEDCYWYLRFDKQAAYRAYTQASASGGEEHETGEETRTRHAAYRVVQKEDCVIMKAKLEAYPARRSIAKDRLKEYLQTYRA